MSVPKDLLETIKNSDSILLQAHQKPDGDAIGSIIALGKGLKQLGKDVDYWVDTSIDPKLKFFPEMESFNKDLKDHYDSLIIVDCSTMDYSVSPEQPHDYDNLIVIDHHESNKKYGKYNYVYETGATGELVYQVLEALGVELDKEIREAIFTALSSDTGSFQFANTNAQTHEIASKIYTPESNFSPISKRLHSLKTLDQMQLYAAAIDSIKLFHNDELAVLFLPYDIISSHGGSENVSDDIANIGMNLDTTKLSVLIKETAPNEFKMSIRSKAPYDVDVSKFAVNRGGGGHPRASGFSEEGDINEIETKLIKDLEGLLE